MKLEHARTGETLKFHFDAWLSRLREDGQLMRELPANRPQRDTLPRTIRRSLFVKLFCFSLAFLCFLVNFTLTFSFDLVQV